MGVIMYISPSPGGSLPSSRRIDKDTPAYVCTLRPASPAPPAASWVLKPRSDLPPFLIRLGPTAYSSPHLPSLTRPSVPATDGTSVPTPVTSLPSVAARHAQYSPSRTSA